MILKMLFEYHIKRPDGTEHVLQTTKCERLGCPGVIDNVNWYSEQYTNTRDDKQKARYAIKKGNRKKY
jgi:hypothetical protein